MRRFWEKETCSHLGAVVPPRPHGVLPGPPVGARPDEHGDAADHAEHGRGQHEDAHLPGVHLGAARLDPAAARVHLARHAAPDVRQAVAVAAQPVQAQALFRGDEHGEQREQRAAEPERADRPRLRLAVGQDRRPAARAGQDAGEQGALYRLSRVNSRSRDFIFL